MNCTRYKLTTKTTIRIFTNGLLLLAVFELFTSVVTGTLADPVSPSQVAAAVEAAVSSATTAESDVNASPTPATSQQESDAKQQLLLAPLVLTQNGEMLPLRSDSDSPRDDVPLQDTASLTSRPPPVTPRGPAVIVEIIASPSTSEQHIEIMASDSQFQPQNYLSDTSNYLYYPVQQDQQQPVNLVNPTPTEQVDNKQNVQQQQQPGSVIDDRINSTPSHPEQPLSLQQYHYHNSNENNQSVVNAEIQTQQVQSAAQGQLQLMLQREQLPFPQQSQTQPQQYQQVEIQQQLEVQQQQSQQQQQPQQYQQVPIEQQLGVQQQQSQQPQHIQPQQSAQQSNYYNQYGNQQQQSMLMAASTAVHPQYYKYYPQHNIGFRNNPSSPSDYRTVYRKRKTRQYSQHSPPKDSYAEGTVQSDNSIGHEEVNREGNILPKHHTLPPFRPSHPLWASQYPVPWLYYVKSTLEIPKSVTQQQQLPLQYPYRNVLIPHNRKSRAYQSKRSRYSPNSPSTRRDATIPDPTKKVVYIEYGGFKPKMVPSVEVRLFENGGEEMAYENAQPAVIGDSQEAYDSSVKFAVQSHDQTSTGGPSSLSSLVTEANGNAVKENSVTTVLSTTAVTEIEKISNTTTSSSTILYSNNSKINGTATTPNTLTSTQSLVIVV
ncbi:putative mediator of RNA polymerase II transcription subunit 12 [Daktulosphaira vitifoliae]|uniref:putative mediator of RNA polymerase II transcription subunit 12 n=1 Tax=Daktulosphaira vitifoliae TaxID=58002 RepID=UPI0021AAF6A9|nr:putative mediator of RNA polymerase II transcription subunit 12 [Daktulosphaira vitifoliae]